MVGSGLILNCELSWAVLASCHTGCNGRVKKSISIVSVIRCTTSYKTDQIKVGIGGEAVVFGVRVGIPDLGKNNSKYYPYLYRVRSVEVVLCLCSVKNVVAKFVNVFKYFDVSGF